MSKVGCMAHGQKMLQTPVLKSNRAWNSMWNRH